MIKNWIERQLNQAINKPLLKLFLLGIKGQLETKKSKPYNHYLRIFGWVLSYAFARYIVDYSKNEIDRSGYNFFIPEYIYKVREESHIYWELTRHAKKLPTTFTYYKWAQNLMYQIDRSGQQKPYHTHSGIQSPQTFDSFLHEYNFPASPQRHSQIMLYLKNLKNPYDMSNYLRAKSINLGDWLRAFYFFIYRELGLTNRWRYDEFVSKPEIYYRWEKLRYCFFLTRNREKLYEILDQTDIKFEDVLKFLVWFS